MRDETLRTIDQGRVPPAADAIRARAQLWPTSGDARDRGAASSTAAIDRTSAISRSTTSGSVRVGTFRAASPSAVAQRLRDVGHPHEITDAEETFAARLLRDHRANVQIGEVAHIDDFETQTRIRRHTSLKQPADDLAPNRRRPASARGRTRRQAGSSSGSWLPRCAS